jgi:hypothetical protein
MMARLVSSIFIGGIPLENTRWKVKEVDGYVNNFFFYH